MQQPRQQRGRKGAAAATPPSKRFPRDLYGPVTPPSPFEAPLERLGLADDADEDEVEREEVRCRCRQLCSSVSSSMI